MVTDGIFLSELIQDPLLSAYSVLIIDDCHDRSVNTDLSICLLKKILFKRQDLKLIISSATYSKIYEQYFNLFKTQTVFIEGR